MKDWKEYIESKEEVLQGKPVLKATRISVEFIVERLAHGWTEKDLLENYPQITEDSLVAVFSYLHHFMKDSVFYIRKDHRA